jgi:hypothetical protein
MPDDLDLRTAANSVWLSVVTRQPLDPAALARLEGESWAAVQNAFLARPPPREYRTDAADALKRDLDLTLAAPGALEDQGFDPPFWIEKNAALRRSHGPGAARAQRLALATAAGRLQDAMLAEGALCLRSPFDGTMRRSTSSFLMDFRRSEGLRAAGNQTAYLFTDGPPLVVLFGGEEGWPMAWYDPVRDLVIRERGFMEIDHFFVYSLAQLRTLAARQPDLMSRYLADASPRRRTLWVGSVDYLSTHMFGDIAGLDRVVANGAAIHADEILVAAKEMFGPVEALFPELDPARIRRLDDPDVPFEGLNIALMNQNAFVVRPAGGFATQGARDRIRRQAAKTGDPAFTERLAAFRRAGTVLFVSLRLQTRRWRHTPAEIGAMLGRIALNVEGPEGLAVIFDGYAHSPQDPVPAAIMAAEAAFIDDIIAALGPSVPVLVSAGRPLADTINAAFAAHAHLSIQGTSCTKPVFLADLPGVVIGPDSFWWDVRDYHDGQSACVVLGPGQAVDVDPVNWPITDFDLPMQPVEVALASVLAADRAGRRPPRRAGRLRSLWRQAAALVRGPT